MKACVMSGLVQDFTDDEIFNMDETALYFKAQSNHTFVTNDDARNSVKINKDRWTVALCCNMSGTNKIPLLVIGKSKHPRTFPKDHSKLGILSWESNGNAWMTKQIFSKWLKLFSELMKTKIGEKRVLLVVDNATTHKVSEIPKNVDLYFLPPNVTSRLQLLDGGVIWSFKSNYRSRLSRLFMRYIQDESTWKTFLKDFTARQAVETMRSAWQAVTSTVITNCAAHVGWTRKISDDTEVEEMDEHATLDKEEQALDVHAPPVDIGEFLLSSADDEVRNAFLKAASVKSQKCVNLIYFRSSKESLEKLLKMMISRRSRTEKPSSC